MRLIDADKLKTSLNEKRDEAITRNANSFGEIAYFSSLATLIAVTDCISSVNEQPTVDAVEVVRCKDCRHWVGEYRYQEYGKNYKKCEVTPYLRTEETHFCAMGEGRKANED